MRIGSRLFLILSLFTASALAQPPAVQSDCDRECLNTYVDRYIDAMIAKDVSDELFARDVKFTENGIRFPLGNEGAWYLSKARGNYRFYVPDVETQQVAYLGTIIERGRSADDNRMAGFSLRLKIVDGLITEVEQLVSRPATNLFGPEEGSSPFGNTGDNVEKMGAPHPIFSEIIPEDERPSREELILTANYYFTGLQDNDGKGYYPFTDDCQRYENGISTAGGPNQVGCKKQFEENLKGVISHVRDRRFVAVDRETGIVFAFAFFDHENINWTWQLGELFKIENGQIRRIEAIFHQAPYGIPSGWSTFEQSYSDAPQMVR